MSCNFPGISQTGEADREPVAQDVVRTLCNKVDANVLQMLDPETLEPIGLARQGILHPDLTGPLSSAHAMFDPVTGDAFNYNLAFEKGQGIYRIFTVSASTGSTYILATITSQIAYIHSMFLTEHYLVLCIWNSHFSLGGAGLLWKRNFVDALKPLDRSKKALWYVIDRTPIEHGGRGLIKTLESEPFFSFHTINAYEETKIMDDGTKQLDIIADLSAYENLDVLKRFYLENLMSDSPAARSFCDPSNVRCRPSIWRFRLPDINRNPKKPTSPSAADVLFKIEKRNSLELPTINPKTSTRKHRYAYGVYDTGKSSFVDGILKFDFETLTTRKWSVFGQTAGEPIFVPNPEAAEDDDEDNGVLLSVVLDGIGGKSYLLVLDAKNLEEIGRARMKGPVGFGFHGTHFPYVGGRKNRKEVMGEGKEDWIG
ncbi:putative carotenoid cleavage dioxygenase [Phaeomoniella chlamydospora]|uniref:Putative carotenoid cleavage dioxygenase n=1 Tax=Phaeomoniella chlamydospora TaxID=158046 RepID=A0A0G2F329_PHACM|nr:putative carotenoid cleavage dioxygenase [Phaeomoniella chlamydospora]